MQFFGVFSGNFQIGLKGFKKTELPWLRLVKNVYIKKNGNNQAKTHFG